MTQLLARIGIDPSARNVLAPFVDESLSTRLSNMVLSGGLADLQTNPIPPEAVGSSLRFPGGWNEAMQQGLVHAPSEDPAWVAEFYRGGSDAWVELKPLVMGQGDEVLRFRLKDRFTFSEEDPQGLRDFVWLHQAIAAGFSTLLGAEKASAENRLGPEAWDVVANLKTALYVLRGGDPSLAPNLESLEFCPETDGVLSLIAAMDTASRNARIWTPELFERCAKIHQGGVFREYDMRLGCGEENVHPEKLLRAAVLNGALTPDEFVAAKLAQLDYAQKLGLPRVCFPSATLDGLSRQELVNIHLQLCGNERERTSHAGLHALGDAFMPGTGYFEGYRGTEILRELLPRFSFLKTSVPDWPAQRRYLALAEEVDGRIMTGDDYNTPFVLAYGAKRYVDNCRANGEGPMPDSFEDGVFIDSPLVAGGLLGNINISPRQFIAGMYHLSSYVHEALKGNECEAKQHMEDFFDIWSGYMAASIFFFFGPRNPTPAYTGHLEAAYRLRGTLNDGDRGHVLPARDYYWRDEVSRRLTDGTVLLMLAAAREINIGDIEKVVRENQGRLLVR